MFIVRIIRQRQQRRILARYYRELAQIKSQRILDKLEADGIFSIVKES